MVEDMQSLAFGDLQMLARGVGLDVVGVTDAAQLHHDLEHLKGWQEAGYAGDMDYMLRDPHLLASPERLLEGVRSVIMVALAYDRAPRPPLPPGFGRVARYAWGRDYHKVLRKRLELLIRRVEEHLGRSLSFRAFSDSVPLLERALARRSELAFIGKNTMAIVPGRGSFFLLGEVLWELDIVDRGQSSPSASHCGTCTNCLSRCPTQAFVSERVLDARRCISYLTIEKRGALTLTEREWLGEWVFGCDICQEVCPFNFVSLKKGYRASIEEFNFEQGVGPALDLRRVLEIRSHDEFVGYFGGTALMRAKREGLLRNAAVVAANTGAVELVEPLQGAVREDESPIVRQHAVWALTSLGIQAGGSILERVKGTLLAARQDPSPEVRGEAGECEKLL
jgi:epoxyqueuosine reductase